MTDFAQAAVERWWSCDGGQRVGTVSVCLRHPLASIGEEEEEKKNEPMAREVPSCSITQARAEKPGCQVSASWQSWVGLFFGARGVVQDVFCWGSMRGVLTLRGVCPSVSWRGWSWEWREEAEEAAGPHRHSLTHGRIDSG